MDIFVLTPQKRSIGKNVLGIFCLLIAAVMLLMACIFWPFFLGTVLFFFIFWFLIPRGNIEYECSYLDGDIRFARIRAKRSRKNLKAFKIDDVLQIAPAGDRSVYKYENDQKVKVMDYTSRQPGVPYYDMVIKSEDTTYLYKVELDDKYLNAVCIKNAYKVIRRK